MPSTLFPLFNSLRVAALATLAAFFLGIFAAYYASRAKRVPRAALDIAFTMPLVLPPTVIGFFLLKLLGPYGPIGSFMLKAFNLRLAMQWHSAIYASGVAAFPLMYRTARGAFAAMDPDIVNAAYVIGMSRSKTFWKVIIPCCKNGILAGSILAFARALGEYGATSMLAGYTPGKTATISTTVYQLWRIGQDQAAYMWAFVNIIIAIAALLLLGHFEGGGKKWG